MNKFYELNIRVQWGLTLLLLVFMMVMIIGWIELMKVYPFIFFLIFLMTPLIQFFATPLFTLLGYYQYLSPMLLAYFPNEKIYNLHNGTSFDYLFVLRGYKPGIKLRNKILEYYLDGLLKLADEIENKRLPETVIIRGSSYFLDSSAIKNLGFTLSDCTPHEKINILVNYIDLLWMYSLSFNKLRFPNVSNIKRASITGSELLKRKSQLLSLKRYLTARAG